VAVQITTAPMAAVMPDAGAQVLRRLANASLDFGGQSVFGLLADEPAEVGMGGQQVRVRRKTLLCLAVDLQEVVGGVQQGTACTFDGAAWLVADLVPYSIVGQVLVVMERP